MKNRDAAIAAVLELQEFLRQSRPKWTDALPTREGYYWVCDDKRSRPRVVEVRVDYSEKETPLVVQEGDPADQGVKYLITYRGCWWSAVPLEVPRF